MIKLTTLTLVICLCVVTLLNRVSLNALHTKIDSTTEHTLEKDLNTIKDFFNDFKKEQELFKE